MFFSPNGGATEAVVRKLGNAKKEILMQAYSFTFAPIAKASVVAHKRGVKVTAVLESSQRLPFGEFAGKIFDDMVGGRIDRDERRKLNLLRLTGGGPRFMRFGRSVRYKLREVVSRMNKPDYANTTKADEAKHEEASA